MSREPPGPPTEDGPHRRVARSILKYSIFSPRLVTPILRREPLRTGDTVGIDFHAFPGVDLFFATRVTEVFDTARADLWRTGFTYQTLVGHPELGEETFSVEKDMTSGNIVVALRSWSEPGLFITRLGAPVARWVQRIASHSALDHLEKVATSTA